MVNRKIAAMCLLAVSLLGGMLPLASSLLQGSKPVPDLQDMLGAPKTVMQMQLYGANRDPATGKSITGLHEGYDYYSADGKKKIRSYLVYENGATEEVFFRADETKESSRDFYPAEAGEQAILRATARFSKDGKWYEVHDVYRVDGKFERRGILLADGNYEQTYFCADGKTVEKKQLFSKGKGFLSETAIFCENGKPIRSVEDGEYGAKVLILYRKDGSVSSKQTMHSSEFGASYIGDVFDEKGTILLHFDRGGFSKTVQTIVDGKPDMEWAEHMYMSYSLDITQYDKNGGEKQKLFTQHIRPVEQYNWSKGRIFKGVTEYGADQKIAREIEMTEDGSKPALLIYPTSEFKKKIVHYLDEQGKIAKTVLRDTSDKTETAMPLPADRDPKIPAAELVDNFDKRPSAPEWDDGNTSTSNKVYDFH